jgi:LacI family transcriptional regulator
MTRKSSSITIRDVAKKAGVSVATVSRYINNTAPVSDEVAARIEAVMADLKYVPHAAARQLATRKTSLIGLLLTNMHNDFFAPLLHGIEAEVRSRGYNLLVSTYHWENHDSAPPPIGPHIVDGLLVFADSVDDKHLVDLYQSGFPTVLIHRSPPPNVDIPCVTVENKAATRKLIRHLIEVHGKRRILFVSGPQFQEDSHWREIGYRAALEDSGIEVDEKLKLPGDFDGTVAYTALKDYLNHQPANFDAVFSGDDDAAIGIINALRDCGYRVPEDIPVVGFDDSRLSAYLSPPLTTVRAPTEQVGRTATRQLFHLLDRQPVSGVTLLPTEIILRRSCGCTEGTDQPAEEEKGGETSIRALVNLS